MSDHIVTFKARETPSNESSTVLLKHKVFITERSRNGNQITWDIDKLSFDEPGGGDWTDSSPSPSTWVVTHENVDAPVANDFTKPPNVSGTAVNDGIGDALTYAMTLGTCTSGESSMFGGDVTCAEYNYVAGSTTIAEEAEDEPEETEIEDDPN